MLDGKNLIGFRQKRNYTRFKQKNVDQEKDKIGSQANADKMTLHADQDSLYTAMKARCSFLFASLQNCIIFLLRWVKVDEAAKEWTKKLAELSGMWSKQTGLF